MKKYSELTQDEISESDKIIVLFDDVAQIRNLTEKEGLLFFEPKKYYYGSINTTLPNGNLEVMIGQPETYEVSPERVYMASFAVGDRVAIKWPEDHGPRVGSKIYFGSVIDESPASNLIMNIRFDEKVGEPNDPDPYTWLTLKRYLVYTETLAPKSQSNMPSRTIVRNTISDLITNVLFQKDSNRVMLLLDEMKNKFGADFEAELVLSDIFTSQEAELFIEILNGLKREEDVRLGLSDKIETKPIEETQAKRGRNKKAAQEPTEVVIEPEIEIEEPDNDIDFSEIEDFLSDEDLGDLLEGLEDLEDLEELEIKKTRNDR